MFVRFAAEAGEDVFGPGVIEAGHRFVGEEEGRFGEEGAGDGDALLFPSGSFGGPLAFVPGEAEFGEEGEGVRLVLLGEAEERVEGGETAEATAEGVAEHGVAGGEVQVLVDEAEGGAGGEVPGDGAFRGLAQAGEAGEQAGLARAGGAGEGHEFAGVEGEVQLAEEPPTVEAEAEADGFDQGLHLLARAGGVVAPGGARRPIP